MTVGQIMVVCGICLVLVAVLLAVVGSVLLHKKKKMVLLEIEHEYRILFRYRNTEGNESGFSPSGATRSDSGR